jgi:dihydroanticapsin dehydrogenase
MKTPNRVVLVTGGAQGIGLGIARYFAARGDAVVIADRDVERGEAAQSRLRQEGRRALFVPADLREESAVRGLVDRALAEWGRLDVLCNNAGTECYRRGEDYTLEEWNAIVDTNLRGAFLCSKYALPSLRRQRGSIINIASIQAMACEKNISVYAASKAGLLALTRGLALDYAREGVRVNAICPGAIRTAMMAGFLAEQENPEAALAAFETSIPLGRLGEPEDIAGVVYFLASPQAAYITGATLVVDGGVLAKLAL